MSDKKYYMWWSDLGHTGAKKLARSPKEVAQWYVDNLHAQGKRVGWVNVTSTKGGTLHHYVIRGGKVANKYTGRIEGHRVLSETALKYKPPRARKNPTKAKRNPLRDLPSAGVSPHSYEKFIKDKKGYIGVWLTGYSHGNNVTAFLINKKPTGGRGAAWPEGTKSKIIGIRSYRTWNGAVTRYRNLTSPKRIKDFFGEKKYEAARRKVFPKKRGRKPAAKGRRYKRWTLPPLSEAELLTGDHGNVMYYIYQLEHKPTGILGHGGSPKSALEDLKKNLDFEFSK